MLSPNSESVMQTEEERYTIEFEFLSHRLFKFNSVRNYANADIDFICLLCQTETPVLCNNKCVSFLRTHIGIVHPESLQEFDVLCGQQGKMKQPEGVTKDAENYVRFFHTNPETAEPLRNSFVNFLNESCFTDLTLHLCDGKLLLHRLVLGSASPFLRTLLEHGNCTDCEHNIDIILPSFTVSDIQPILPFLYGYAEIDQKIEGQLLDCLQLGSFFSTTSLKREQHENINIKIKQERQDEDVVTNFVKKYENGESSSAQNVTAHRMPLSEDQCIDCGGNLPPRHYCPANVEPYVGETGFEWGQEDDDYTDPDYTAEEKPKKKKFKKESTAKSTRKEKLPKKRYIKVEDGCV